MLFSPEAHHLVLQAQRKDLLSDIENHHLRQVAALQTSGKFIFHWKAANWLGAQMVSWGSMLQSYSTRSSISIPASEMRYG